MKVDLSRSPDMRAFSGLGTGNTGKNQTKHIIKSFGEVTPLRNNQENQYTNNQN